MGIIGAGVIADFHAKAIQAMDGAELVAAYARKEDKANTFASKYGCKGYSDLEGFSRSSGYASGYHLLGKRSTS